MLITRKVKNDRKHILKKISMRWRETHRKSQPIFNFLYKLVVFFILFFMILSNREIVLVFDCTPFHIENFVGVFEHTQNSICTGESRIHLPRIGHLTSCGIELGYIFSIFCRSFFIKHAKIF